MQLQVARRGVDDDDTGGAGIDELLGNARGIRVEDSG